MLNQRHRRFMVIAYLLCIWLLLSNCATEEETIRPEKLSEGIDLEFLGNRIELRNLVPRNGEDVEVTVIVRNRGNQDVRRVPVFFYDNLRVFSTEEIDLEPGGQRRLIARWKAISGIHTISAIIDPAHHFKEMRKETIEVSTTISVK